MKRKGIIGSVITFFVVAILFTAFYQYNNGDVVGGIGTIVAKGSDFISRSADSLLSFEWFRNIWG